jgi:hypothetical protein
VSDDPEWFAPKRYGYGPGLPVSWQGGALIAAFIAAVLAIVLTFRHRPLVMIALLVPLVVTFMVVSCRVTRGGCRWRWGEEE